MNEVAIVSKTKTMTVCLVFFCMCSFFLLFFLSFSFEASIQLPKLWGGGDIVHVFSDVCAEQQLHPQKLTSVAEPSGFSRGMKMTFFSCLSRL